MLGVVIKCVLRMMRTCVHAGSGDEVLVTQSVILQPVSRKGLHQGRKQTSVYLRVIPSASHCTTSVFFSNHDSKSIQNFGTQTQKNNSSCFGAFYIAQELSAGTCIQQADLFYYVDLHRNRCQPQLARANLGRGFGKNAGEWTGRVKISQEEISGSKCSMHGYILNYSRL